MEVTYFRLLPKTDFRTRPLNAPGNSRRNSFLFICFTLEETSLHFSFTLFTHEKRQRNLIFPVCKTEKKNIQVDIFFPSVKPTNYFFRNIYSEKINKNINNRFVLPRVKLSENKHLNFFLPDFFVSPPPHKKTPIFLHVKPSGRKKKTIFMHCVKSNTYLIKNNFFLVFEFVLCNQSKKNYK